MTREQLLEKISKKEQQIQKIERNLPKYFVSEEFSEMVERYFQTKDFSELENYKKQHNLFYLPEYYSKAYDLHDAQNTLAKYKLQLQKLNNYQNAEKIEVIWNFLQNWKSNVIKFIESNAAQYFQLVKDEKQSYKQFLINNYNVEEENSLDWHIRCSAEHNFKKQYYEDIHSLTKKVTKINREWKGSYLDGHMEYVDYTINYSELNKILDEDVRKKYENLVNEVTEITGEITDASNLRISVNGEICGLVYGKNGKAKIQTFSAGGYNIQCFHYRHKVSEVK